MESATTAPTASRPLHVSPAAIALVMAGGVAGAAARDALAQALGPRTFPVATLVANLSGAFLLGLLLEALARAGDDGGRRRQLRLLAGSGFMGAYTTYSTFAVETVQLVHHAHAATAALYAAVTVVGGLVVVGAGIAVGAAGHAAVPRRPDRPLPMDPDVDVDADFDDEYDDDPDDPGEEGR